VPERGLDAELFPKVKREIRTALEIIAAAKEIIAAAKSDLLLAVEAQRDALEEGAGRAMSG